MEEICAAARAAGALAIVDGAHAPGQLPLDLDSLGADVYAGNCHKWLCAPKGAGFLWVRPEHQEWIEPLVVSWGWRDDADFAERHGWAGTRDPAAYLTVPKAIEVHATFDSERQRAVAEEADRRLASSACCGSRACPPRSCAPSSSHPATRASCGGAVRAPRVEARVYDWEGRAFLRVSIGPYNDEEDVDRLVAALNALRRIRRTKHPAPRTESSAPYW